MATYVVTYDLHRDDNYEPLHVALRTYPAWGIVAESTWVIVTNNSAAAIRDRLQALIPTGSRLFVVRSAGEAAWTNTICNSQWLRDNL